MAGAAGVTIDLTQEDEDNGSSSQTAIMIDMSDNSDNSDGEPEIEAIDSKVKFTCFYCYSKDGSDALRCRDCDSRIHITCFQIQHGQPSLEAFRNTEICPGCQAIQISTMSTFSPPVFAGGSSFSSSSFSSSSSRVNHLDIRGNDDEYEEEEEEVKTDEEEEWVGKEEDEGEKGDDSDFEAKPKKAKAPKRSPPQQTSAKRKGKGGTKSVHPVRAAREAPPAPAPADCGSTPDAEEENPRSLGSAGSFGSGGSGDSGGGSWVSGGNRPRHEGAGAGSKRRDLEDTGLATKGQAKKRKRELEEVTGEQGGWEGEGKTSSSGSSSSSSSSSSCSSSSSSSSSRGLPRPPPPPPQVQRLRKFQKQPVAYKASAASVVTQPAKEEKEAGKEEEEEKEEEEKKKEGVGGQEESEDEESEDDGGEPRIRFVDRG